ncbi:hypothetical protein ASPCAL05977 [Aspergillus calidoustus]|uniref:FAD-binding domain-containing protein n=1 Tax=Aspergillus calidoustus TaxID=454130 RepID=A0A0U4Z586_ASPCI|nr:hypothetical protein ASPCAL05977 [Aspergillus calidoustus]
MSIPASTPVLIVGAGPSGLIAALQLATNNVPCLLVERNETTTKWPKMDVTNCRSMEIFRRLGIAEGIRDVGVPGHYSHDVILSTGLSEGGEVISEWKLRSPDTWRAEIRAQNDGSMPREPWQRCSQAVLEAWLKPQIQANPSITSVFGCKFESLVETEDGVESKLVTTDDGKEHIVRSQFVIGCDGAGSRVRRNVGIELQGGPVPGAMYLVHFKSHDLARLRVQGQFWHIFTTLGDIIISQNEKDTWTLHHSIPLGTDISTLDPREAVYTALGGETNIPYPIEIDEILVTSAWRPNICIAERYASNLKRVFLAGDSAHQNIPTGGYGMNTAVGDSFDIGWKLAAVVHGHGGAHLLESYERERRPVAVRNIERSGVHWSVHSAYKDWCAAQPGVVLERSERGAALRAKIAEWFSSHDAENLDIGLEMGYRYTSSNVVVIDEPREEEPPFYEREYVPTTWPGARVPHVFLRDGVTSTHDLLGTGPEYTLVDFTSTGSYIESFAHEAKTLKIPFKPVHLPDEDHVRRIWERDAVLVRPDDHVAWRSSLSDKGLKAREILQVAVGQRAVERSETPAESEQVQPTAFSSTIGNVSMDDVEMRAKFQL